MKKAIPHTVKLGERWDTLAHHYYGDALQMGRIINANQHLPLAETLPVGQVVLIPLINKVTRNDEMPPWLRGQA